MRFTPDLGRLASPSDPSSAARRLPQDAAAGGDAAGAIPVRVALVGLLALAMGCTILRLWAASRTGLVPDEAYYWLWSERPQAGYYDHPPMIAWWIWLSTQAFGRSTLAIRLLPVLSSAADTLLIYALAREMNLGSRAALLSGLLLNAMLMFGLNAAVATPDAPSVTFWLLTLWTLARLRRTGALPLWLAVGLFAGLGCASKYTNLFLGPGIFLWLVVDRDSRRHCSPAWIAAGLFVAVCAFCPVLFWNAEHGWISFVKQFGRIGQGSAAGWHLPELLATQLGLLNPFVVYLAVAGSMVGLRGRGWLRGPVLFLIATSLPLVAYMVVHSFHDRVQGNWLLPIYPAVAILAAVATENVSPSADRISRLAIPFGLGILTAVFVYMASPFAGMLPVASPADGAVGWSELAAEVERLARDNKAAWIGTADYGVTGELTFHLASATRVTEIIERARYSFEADKTAVEGQTGLLVLRGRDIKPQQIAGCFRSMIPLGTITRNAGSRELEHYLLLKVTGASSGLIASGCTVVREHPAFPRGVETVRRHAGKTI